jgi:hypothetical protein
MIDTKKSAPGAFDAQGPVNIERIDSVSQQDFTLDAAASALQIGLEAIAASALQLVGGNPHASLIGAHAAMKAIGAAADTLATIVGRGNE